MARYAIVVMPRVVGYRMSEFTNSTKWLKIKGGLNVPLSMEC